MRRFARFRTDIKLRSIIPLAGSYARAFREKQYVVSKIGPSLFLEVFESNDSVAVIPLPVEAGMEGSLAYIGSAGLTELRFDEFLSPVGKCRISMGGSKSSIVRGIHVVVAMSRRILGGELYVYNRGFNCDIFDNIRFSKVIGSVRSPWLLSIVYRRGNDTYMLFDSLITYTHIKLRRQPKKISEGLGVVVLYYNEYMTIVSPVGSVVELPASNDNLRPIGYSGEGYVYLYDVSSRMLYMVDSGGLVEPAASCRDIKYFLTVKGHGVVVCDGIKVFGVDNERLAMKLLGLLSSNNTLVVHPYIIHVDDNDKLVIAEAANGTESYIVIDFDGYTSYLTTRHDILTRLSVEDGAEVIDCCMSGPRIKTARYLRIEGGCFFLSDGRCVSGLVEVVIEDYPLIRGDSGVGPLPLLCSNSLCVKPIRYEASGTTLRTYFPANHNLQSSSTLVIGDVEARLNILKHVKLEVKPRVVRVRPIDVGVCEAKVSYRLSGFSSSVRVDVLPPSCAILLREHRLTRDDNGYELSLTIRWNRNSSLAGGASICAIPLLLKAWDIPVPILVEQKFTEPHYAKLARVEVYTDNSAELLKAVAVDDGYIVARINDETFIVKGQLAIRLPSGNIALSLEHAGGVETYRFKIPANPAINVSVRDDKIIIECIDYCLYSCGLKAGGSRHFTINIEDLTYCNVVTYTSRGRKTYSAAEIVEAILRLAVRSASLLAKSSKLLKHV
ncbi:hypothetical protein [Hyperthermus butylicus]|uniref:Uncharacterized protein n=1 Tax=Hyperthermus butylicus (strain DSM 5456 / JCM 9403 / PLM1-5) TaxID=415426 RepID=A2BLV4_HYPBU|nr:hypothetical protein [Hyperthermus butylicus]ABM80965.1 hypothetical protein Hbut_1125 [Hyperthermus butylicus DSM 5456]